MQEEPSTIGVFLCGEPSRVEYECRDARERGIRPPSKHHSVIPPMDPIISHEEKEEASPLDGTQSVDSTHLSEEESSTLSSTSLSSNEVTVGDSDDSVIATDSNDDPTVALDDNDDFIVNDDILDEFQQMMFGKREETVSDPFNVSYPYAFPSQEDPMNSFQPDVCSSSWESSLFLFDDGVQENDCPFTSFSIPVGESNVY